MLHEFLSSNRSVLIDQCRVRAVQRTEPKDELDVPGIATFLDQLIGTLTQEHAGAEAQTPSDRMSEIGETARAHGRKLAERSFSVDQVVHHYGDLCQSITALAFRDPDGITVDEFRTLNDCLDHAIAGAVTGFAFQHDEWVREGARQASNERLGYLAHELRNEIQAATLAFTAIKQGNVGATGATGAILDRSLNGLRKMIDNALAEVRTTAGMPIRYEVLSVSEFIDEIRLSSLLEARVGGCELTVAAIAPELAVGVDRDLIFSALRNLLQNAFKFTKPHTEVSLGAFASGDRVVIEVSDHCGGLPAGAAATMFLPFAQTGKNRSGLGLGLSIAQRCVEANCGVLSVRDVPGVGCVFSISLPRCSLPYWTMRSQQRAAWTDETTPSSTPADARNDQRNPLDQPGP